MKPILTLLSMGILLATTPMMVACGKQTTKDDATAQQQMQPATVDVQTVTLQPLPLIQSFSGRISAVETSEIRPQVSGIIDAVLFQEGGVVKQGQELYRINKDNYVSANNTSLAAIQTAEASLISAKANLVAQQAVLAQAQADLARVNELVKIDAVSQQLHDQYTTAVKTAQANVEAAKATINQAQASIYSAKAHHDASSLDIHRTIIRAPISGRISISAVTAGALVSAQQATPLATISRTDMVYVDISQSASEMLRLRQQIASGQAAEGTTQVQIVLENGEIYPLLGKLALANASVNESTGAITLRAIFPNPDGLLIPGMYVTANVAQSVIPHAALVPQSAVTRTAKGTSQVYVVQDDKIQVRPVEVAGTYQGQWVVSSGLQDGDTLVVMGGTKVKPEQTVKTRLLPNTSNKQNHLNPQTQAHQVDKAISGQNNDSLPPTATSDSSAPPRLLSAPKNNNSFDDNKKQDPAAEAQALADDVSSN